MANRFADVLERFETGAVIQPGDRDLIREALESQIRVAFFLQGDEWTIGRDSYPDWIGFAHIQKLIAHPGERLQLHAPHDENARKATQKTIRRALDALENTQPEIALHLKSHIKTGTAYTYSGTWKWQIAP